VCDPDEFCPGVPGGTCAADVVAPPTTVCRSGSGDLCDPNELCPGVPGGTCAADVVAPSGTVCRAVGGVCDVADSCTGIAGQACPADAKASNTTVCRAAAGVCDVAEMCTGTSNACPSDAHQPNGTSCSNGLFCDGAETCQAGSCAPGTPPCMGFAVCNEGTDMCQMNVCPAGPQGGCRTAAKNILLIKNKTDNSKDKLIWKYVKGVQQTLQGDFADPTATANYALCIYAGGTNTLVASMNIPPSNTKWKLLGSKGYKYLATSPYPDSGAQKVILKGNVAGKPKALVKGRGANLPDPLDMGPLGTPVKAQLLNYQTGICWEGNFSTFKKNSSTIFKAKNP
jgi:hypothetical protein